MWRALIGTPYYPDCIFIVFCYFFLLSSPVCFAASFSHWSISFLLFTPSSPCIYVVFFVSITLLIASNLYFLVARCSFFTSVFQHSCEQSLLLALITNNPCSFSVPLIISICFSSCLHWWQAFLVLIKHRTYTYSSLWMLIDFRILTAIICTLCVQSVANVLRDIKWTWPTLLLIFVLCLIKLPNWCPTYLSEIRRYQSPKVTCCHLWEKYCNSEAVPVADRFHDEARIIPEEELSWFEERIWTKRASWPAASHVCRVCTGLPKGHSFSQHAHQGAKQALSSQHHQTFHPDLEGDLRRCQRLCTRSGLVQRLV